MVLLSTPNSIPEYMIYELRKGSKFSRCSFKKCLDKNFIVSSSDPVPHDRVVQIQFSIEIIKIK